MPVTRIREQQLLRTSRASERFCSRFNSQDGRLALARRPPATAQSNQRRDARLQERSKQQQAWERRASAPLLTSNHQSLFAFLGASRKAPVRTRRCMFGRRDKWLRHNTESRFQMSTFSDSYVLKVLLATPTPTRGLETVARRWRWLRTSLLDPYQPELHYMRGPGPKWREKHARGKGR